MLHYLCKFAEETVSTYKQVCAVVQKKLLEYFPSAGKGTDGQSVDKRLKRTADFLLGQSLIEQGRVLSKQQNSTCLGQVTVTGMEWGILLFVIIYLTYTCEHRCC